MEKITPLGYIAAILRGKWNFLSDSLQANSLSPLYYMVISFCGIVSKKVKFFIRKFKIEGNINVKLSNCTTINLESIWPSLLETTNGVNTHLETVRKREVFHSKVTISLATTKTRQQHEKEGVKR
jgi:hypothetical protein